MNRRQFVAGSGIAAATAALTGLAPASRRPAVARSTSAAGAAAWHDLDPGDWNAVRARFAVSPDWIHMAGLLLSSHPEPVREAIERHRRGLDDNPAHYLYGGGHGGEAAVRAAAAAYMAARPQDIALTGSTTMGLAMVYNGLELRPGQELLTTSHDHRATYESLEYRAQRTGARLRRVRLYRGPRDASADEIVDSLVRAVRPETRVAAVTWVHSSTGVKLPIPALAEALARLNSGRADEDRVLLCVDGVHGFGAEDAAAAELGCDFFIAGTHKWLFGPRGTGLIWARPEVQRFAGPTIPSFTRDGTWGGLMTPGGFHSFEHRWALAEAFEFHRRLGRERVAGRVRELNSQAKDGLSRMPHVTLYTPLAEELSSGMICFDVRGRSPEQVVRALRRQGIIASRTPYSPSFARLAPGLLNTADEVDATLAAIRALA